MTTFAAVRADLVSRGLLDGEYRLTPAGHRHVDQLLAALPTQTAASNPNGRRVRWNMRRTA